MPTPFIRPRWVPASVLTEAERAVVVAYERKRIARNKMSDVKPFALRKRLHVVDVSWHMGELHKVKVAMVRAHPNKSLFPAHMHKFLTERYRHSAMLARDYWVSRPALDAMKAGRV